MHVVLEIQLAAWAALAALELGPSVCEQIISWSKLNHMERDQKKHLWQQRIPRRDETTQFAKQVATKCEYISKGVHMSRSGWRVDISAFYKNFFKFW